MKTSFFRSRRRGYTSILMVLVIGMALSVATLYTFKRSLATQAVQSSVQLRTDYTEKEEAALRSIVGLTANRAILCMQQNSAANPTNLTWQSVFTGALDASNSRASIDNTLLAAAGGTGAVKANNSDSTAAVDVTTIFKASQGNGLVFSSVDNRATGSNGYPAPLTTNDALTLARDQLYPVISNLKVYGNTATGLVRLSVATYPDYNLLTYPQINFGYKTPGSDLVAKRNWWTFTMDFAGNAAAATRLPVAPREFVLSIYEIPSQLAISSSAFMSLGQNSDNTTWGSNIQIDGSVFAGQAELKGGYPLEGLASRQGANIAPGSKVGGLDGNGDPFAVGVREEYQSTKGAFFPVSQASESGRVAFIPISRGADFFDAYSTNHSNVTKWNGTAATPTVVQSGENNMVSTQGWDSYSVGALQCAMRMDILKCDPRPGSKPNVSTAPRTIMFQYLKGGVRHAVWLPIPSALGLLKYTGVLADAGFGSTPVASENQTYTPSRPVDVAYGANGSYNIKRNVSLPIKFNNATFGDPAPGKPKSGYITVTGNPLPQIAVPSGDELAREGGFSPTGSAYRNCIKIYPNRVAAYVAALGGDSVATVNNSIAININYSNEWLGSEYPVNPSKISSPDDQYAVVLDECDDLSAFTNGFSLVTNMRLYIADDFNIVPIATPAGVTGTFYPPASLFAPEKRYGLDANPLAVAFTGQVGSVAKAGKVQSSDTTKEIRPLETRDKSGNLMNSSQLTINLFSQDHPAYLPPITMKNWLILLEERNKQFVPVPANGGP